MLHMFMEKGPWFRAKKYGYGAGLPFKRQGWFVFASYLLAMIGTALIFEQSTSVPKFVAYGLFVIFTAIFLTIVHNRTEGGWKWRWGGDA